MREILFRGKIIELCECQGQWLEGFYAVENGKPFIAIPKENGLNGFYCDPETVGQYTGLKDKNGTRVFEGDVVEYSEIDVDGSDDKYIGVIYYNQSKANYVIQKREYMVNFVTSWIGDVEVIGNIHDNPELLEVKQ